jgi:hypothetical protein
MSRDSAFIIHWYPVDDSVSIYERVADPKGQGGGGVTGQVNGFYTVVLCIVQLQ